MRYLTKEWYETAQKTHMHYVKVSKKASEFSEEYYKKLYSKAEKDWIKLQRKIYNVDFEKIYPEQYTLKYSEDLNITRDEYENMKERYSSEREIAKKEFENRPPFDIDAEKERFNESYRSQILNLQENLPGNILEQIADIRVLALGYSEKKIKKLITEFCEGNMKIVNDTLLEYDKARKKELAIRHPEFVDDFIFHDCIISSCYEDKDDLIISLEDSDDSDVKKIILLNCEIIKKDAPLDDGVILYEEFYIDNDRYEIHFLIWKELNELVDFIVSVSDVRYVFYNEPKRS